jgi:putative endonuclease
VSRARGRVGESQAGDVLVTHGYEILQTNYTCRLGEIDLVCRHGEYLVFVEVRTRADDEHGLPEETVGTQKQRRIILAARHYLMVHQLDDVPCRFDVVSIVGDNVKIFENAFET